MNVTDSATGSTLVTPFNIIVNIHSGHHRFGLVRRFYLVDTFSDFFLHFVNLLMIFLFTLNAFLYL